MVILKSISSSYKIRLAVELTMIGGMKIDLLN